MCLAGMKKEKEDSRMLAEYQVYRDTLERFLASSDCEDAVTQSTRASWGGSYYCLELFPDGRYEVLWKNEIGNLYEPPGLMLPVPNVDEPRPDDVEEDEWIHLCFEVNEDDMKEFMRADLNETLHMMEMYRRWSGKERDL